MNSKLRGKRNQAQGKQAELLAKLALIKLEYRHIKKISNAWRVHRGRDGRIISATPEEKVDGDWHAVAHGGISVLAEVKKTTSDRLTYSTLADHQHANLTDHANAGGISLLIWVYENQAHVMQWPIAGFVPHSSIKLDRAKALCLLNKIE